MLTLEQAARTLGMSQRQLRRRIEATAPLLAPYIRRGEKNRLILDYAAIKILQDVEARRASGVTLKEAIARVRDDLRGNHRSKLGQDEGQTEDIQDQLIAELRSRVRFLEEENARLWSLVDDLKTQLALPPPRRRWWPWPWRRTA